MPVHNDPKRYRVHFLGLRRLLEYYSCFSIQGCGIIWSILEVNQYKLAREKTVKLTSKKGKKSELNEVQFRSIK